MSFYKRRSRNIQKNVPVKNAPSGKTPSGLAPAIAARKGAVPAYERIEELQRKAGNHAVVRLLRSGTLQAKYEVGPANDPYEREADRVAGEVVSMKDTPSSGKAARRKGKTPVGPNIQLSRLTRAAISQSPHLAGSLDSSIDLARGGGRSLSARERSYYEPRFGADFGDVRIHTDARAGHLAGAIQAKAFTVGRDIFFGAGQYSPGTIRGKRLMAHELTHTIQQDSSTKIRRYGHPPHRAIVVESLKGTYTKEEIGKIYKGNFERDFAQVPSVLVNLILAWKEWKQTGFTEAKLGWLILEAIRKLAASLSNEESIKKMFSDMTKQPFKGSEEVDHVDNPGKGADQINEKSGLPQNIHNSRENIKQQMLHAYGDFINGRGSKEDTSDVRSRKIIEQETVKQVERSGGKITSRPMDTRSDQLWNAVGEHLGRATHATEDFFAHSNWVEIAIYQKRHKQVEIYNRNSPMGAPKYFPRDRDYQMSDRVRKYGQMGLFTGTFGMFDKIHAVADKVEALVHEIQSAKLPPRFAEIQKESLKSLKEISENLNIAAKGAQAVASDKSHSNIAKDSPPKSIAQDKDKTFENSLRCSVEADRRLFVPMKRIMLKKNYPALVRQLNLVDRIIAPPSPRHPLWSIVREGRLSWIDGKPHFR